HIYIYSRIPKYYNIFTSAGGNENTAGAISAKSCIVLLHALLLSKYLVILKTKVNKVKHIVTTNNLTINGAP
ncbi:MAG: hypothetical protein WBI89_07390, partial [Caldicoprobacterales bacterium]